MVPNKDWMNIENYRSEDYEKGVKSSFDYAFTKLETKFIRCPCMNVST